MRRDCAPLVAGGEPRDEGHQAIISTGLPLLDEVTGGLREGTLWWVTGTSGTGLSTFVTQLASAAAEGGVRTPVVSCLDDASMVADRSAGADVTVLSVPADEPLDVDASVGTSWRVMVVDDLDVGARPDLATPLARLRGSRSVDVAPSSTPARASWLQTALRRLRGFG